MSQNIKFAMFASKQTVILLYRCIFSKATKKKKILRIIMLCTNFKVKNRKINSTNQLRVINKNMSSSVRRKTVTKKRKLQKVQIITVLLQKKKFFFLNRII